jgi:hypothetical protein
MFDNDFRNPLQKDGMPSVMQNIPPIAEMSFNFCDVAVMRTFDDQVFTIKCKANLGSYYIGNVVQMPLLKPVYVTVVPTLEAIQAGGLLHTSSYYYYTKQGDLYSWGNLGPVDDVEYVTTPTLIVSLKGKVKSIATCCFHVLVITCKPYFAFFR